MSAREQRLASMLARRAERAAIAPPVDDSAPRCTASKCSRPAERAGRCPSHWTPMRSLVGSMLGGTPDLRVSRRAFAAALTTSGVPIPDELDDSVLDSITDSLFEHGYRITVGSRGGRYLERKAATS